MALVVGFTVGYILGARAGKERFEQIKRGANAAWNSKPVKKGRDSVKDFVGDRVTGTTDFVVKKGKAILHSVTDPEKDR